MSELKNKRTRYIINAPIVMAIIMGIGCFIHSTEFQPHPTGYYILTVLMCGSASFFGAIQDDYNNIR